MNFVDSFQIRGRPVGSGAPCYVIAEAGSNHNGQLARALALIDIAADAGADAVKFQLFSADRIAADTAHPIARIDFAGAKTLRELYKKGETPKAWLPKLIKHAQKRNISFLCTPFDEEAVDCLDDLGIPAFKVASFELSHQPLLRHIASKGKPILLSTGMATLGEIEEALSTIHEVAPVPVALFHCGINYPLAFGDVNLRAMATIETAFRVPVGYSDHTLGLAVPTATAARGGSLLEKHFTQDRALPGADHSFAMEPDELRTMVETMRQVETALGSPAKGPVPSELEHLRRGRRSLFAAVFIPAGTTITREMVSVLRPGAGLHPREIPRIVGRQARRDVAAHDPISWDDL